MQVMNVIDLVDTNGYIYDFEQLKQIYNLKGTFLDNQRLINKLPKTWLEVINQNNEKCKFSKFNNLFFLTFIHFSPIAKAAQQTRFIFA